MYLNTSYVDIKQQVMVIQGLQITHLNTSYVDIKLALLIVHHLILLNLNTSYVDIKLVALSGLDKVCCIFKYILC